MLPSIKGTRYISIKLNDKNVYELLLTSVVVLEQFHFVIYYTYIKNEHRNTFNET